MSKQPIKYHRNKKIKPNRWISNGKRYDRYKVKFNYGDWMIVRFEHDGALYSLCTICNDYIHPNYCHDDEDFIVQYSPEKEFIYCPMCGHKNLPDRESSLQTKEFVHFRKAYPNWQDLTEYQKKHLYKL